MNDLISRAAAVDALDEIESEIANGYGYQYQKWRKYFCELPSAQPEIKPISYMECANAMLKMWIDNVLTDGEYNRIMDKLNSKHMADMRGEQDG